MIHCQNLIKHNEINAFRVIFLIIIVFCSKITFPQSSSTNFVVTPSKVDSIKLSELGTVVKEIPLYYNTEGNVPRIGKVVLDQNYIFITLGNFPQEVLQFSSSGRFIRNFNYLDKNIKDAIEYTCDTLNNILYIKHGKRVCLFNYSGVQIRQFEVPYYSPIIFFNNRLWGIDVAFEETYDTYLLYSTDQYDNNIIEGKVYDFWDRTFVSKGPKCLPIPTFSVCEDELYFSIYHNSIIYKITNDSIQPAYQFKINNTDYNYLYQFPSPTQVVNSSFVVYGYRMNGRSFSFLYDKGLRKSYNLKDAEIIDDIYGSENINTRAFECIGKGLFCFPLNLNLIQKYKLNKKSGIALIIVKLK